MTYYRALAATGVLAVLAGVLLAVVGPGPARAEPACDFPWPDTVADGQVVKAWNGQPVRRATVTIHKVHDVADVWGVAVTDRNGEYEVADVCDEEVGIHVEAPNRAYESGWLGCGGEIVPTWEDACSAGLGTQEIRLGRAALP